jgi:hypothetical protein
MKAQLRSKFEINMPELFRPEHIRGEVIMYYAMKAYGGEKA